MALPYGIQAEAESGGEAAFWAGEKSAVGEVGLQGRFCRSQSVLTPVEGPGRPSAFTMTSASASGSMLLGKLTNSVPSHEGKNLPCPVPAKDQLRKGAQERTTFERHLTQ